ncbi:GGDEF domain-containing protein [Kineococcus sp. G2]|uniref:GGDEF domain-containing protein n=1 Tax=Kineococcus sp. G2 TaxID=3127484 RepID=UPI00301E255B
MTPPARLRSAAVPAGFAVLHALAVLLGRASVPEGAAVAVLWPAAGVGFAWLARSWSDPRARRRDTVLLLGSGAAAQLLSGQAAAAALLMAASGAVHALTACWVHHHLQPRGFRLRSPRDVWVLLLAATTGALAGAVVGIPAVTLTLGAEPVTALVGWAVRHTASTLLVAVLWLRAGDRQRTEVRCEAGRAEVLLVTVAACTFFGWLFAQPFSLPLAFLLAPVSVWVGLRLSSTTALWATVLGGAAMVLLPGVGVFQTLPGPRAVLFAQLLVIVLVVVVAPLVLHREERDRLDAEVRAVHRRAAAALEHQARHDALTGLPNRVLLRERLEEALAGGSAGVLYCDLDGFKDVNDTAGHGAGDDVLREVAGRFAARLRPADTLARLGGDEFAVLCPAGCGVDGLREAGERLVAALHEPVVVAAGTFAVGVSVGAATAGSGGSPAERAERLLAVADAAMYAAKRADKHRVHVHADPVRLPRQAVGQAGEPSPSEPSPSGGTRQ